MKEKESSKKATNQPTISLEGIFKDIADALREKGIVGKISPTNMADLIRSLDVVSSTSKTTTTRKPWKKSTKHTK